MFKQWFARLRQSRQDERQQLWLVSFIILFFELALIRFIPAYVRYLGYFTNFILLGAFLGIGIGCLLTKQKRDFWAIFAPLFVLLIIFTVAQHLFGCHFAVCDSGPKIRQVTDQISAFDCIYF